MERICGAILGTTSFPEKERNVGAKKYRNNEIHEDEIHEADAILAIDIAGLHAHIFPSLYFL